MATRYKVLGQVAPAENTDTTLYTVPAGKDAIVSTLVVANTDTLGDGFRIAVRPSGETLEDKHFIAYDVTVPAGDATTFTLGLTMSSGDVLTVRSASGNLSFSAFGSEIDI